LKKFTLLLAAGFLFFCLPVTFGQTTPKARISDKEKSAAVATRNTPPTGTALQRCGTTEAYEELFRQNPAFKAQFEANQRRLAEVSKQRRESSRITALEDTVAVVIHVIGSAALHAQVTDAVLQSQIDTLNVDYNGKNADSVRIPAAFKPVYGKMGITFILAKTDPNGFPTTGIERRTNNISFSAGTSDNAKRTANGGLDGWDGTKYLNLWVAELSGGLLGISVFPGDPRPLNLHGFLCDYRAFGSNAAYLNPSFNKGRTTTHELGHFLNLRHIWGDDGTGANRDVCGSTSCDGSDLVADTPNQCIMNYGNPDPTGTGVVRTDACSGSAPGVMYQNFMDYCDDVALVMFTKGQNARMEDAFNSPDRGPLLSSLAYHPPAPAVGNDARISAILTPVNGSTVNCGTTVTPQVTIMNMGANALSRATIVVRVNGAIVGTPFAWTATTPLTLSQTANITLPAITLPTGASVIKIHSTLPNNLVDANATNDTATVSVTRIDPQALPASNDFETVFLNPGFSISNPNSDALEWIWATPGTGGTGTGAAAIDNFNENARTTIDDLLTPMFLNTGLLPTDSVYLSFDLAYKFYTDLFGSVSDELQILVTNNCGTSYTTLFQGTGNAIATGSTSDIFIPTPADWRKRTFAIGQDIFAGGNFQFVIRNINNWANVLWVDNINVAIKPRKDLQASAITRPSVTECVSANFAPAFTVRNNGDQIITAFKVGYSLNSGTAVEVAVNQTLAPGATYTHTFPVITFPTGTSSIRFYGIDPLSAQGGTDVRPANNEITRSFVVPAKLVNVTEGFEATTFPPASWLLTNPDNGLTWQRVNAGNGSSFSASVDNSNYSTSTYLYDFLQTPIVKTDGADSVIISFDVAYQAYQNAGATFADSLAVKGSKNCATTFDLLYGKKGTALATKSPAGAKGFIPAPNEWRKERVVYDLTAVPATETIFQFVNANAFGNSIYIDNINIEPKFKRDLKVESIEPPIACGTNYTPTAIVRNNGTNTITGFKVAYTVNNGTPVVTTVTGVNFLKNTTMNVALTAATLNGGSNAIKVYSFDPIGAGAIVGDQYLVNDTITRTVATASTVQNNIEQSFDGTTFPPSGWAVGNPDGALTWARTSAGNNSVGSAFLRNFTYYSNGQRDGLFSPILAFSQADSLTLTFDVSATKVDFADPATISLDTLEVLITKDCGNTYTSVYKKWGNTLETVGNDNTGGQFTEFIPNNSALWRNEKVNLAAAAGAANGTLQVVFRNTTNNRNNIYIDNVNIVAKTLPAQLKANGYIVSPSPFTTQFRIWFIQAPTDLKYVSVYNASGHWVWSKEYSNNTANVLQVDLTGKPAGVYIVRISYGGKEVETKIVKTN
jgi:hypothetical protein